jgi:hypothetical protein
MMKRKKKPTLLRNLNLKVIKMKTISIKSDAGQTKKEVIFKDTRSSWKTISTKFNTQGSGF